MTNTPPRLEFFRNVRGNATLVRLDGELIVNLWDTDLMGAPGAPVRMEPQAAIHFHLERQLRRLPTERLDVLASLQDVPVQDPRELVHEIAEEIPGCARMVLSERHLYESMEEMVRSAFPELQPDQIPEETGRIAEQVGYPELAAHGRPPRPEEPQETEANTREVLTPDLFRQTLARLQDRRPDELLHRGSTEQGPPGEVIHFETAEDFLEHYGGIGPLHTFLGEFTSQDHEELRIERVYNVESPDQEEVIVDRVDVERTEPLHYRPFPQTWRVRLDLDVSAKAIRRISPVARPGARGARDLFQALYEVTSPQAPGRINSTDDLAEALQALLPAGTKATVIDFGEGSFAVGVEHKLQDEIKALKGRIAELEAEIRAAPWRNLLEARLFEEGD